MKKSGIVALVGALLVTFGLGTGTGMIVQIQRSEPLIVSTDSAQEFRLVEDAWNIARTNYVDRTATEPQKLAYGSISGMIDSVGDTGHSTFLTPEQVQQLNSQESGTLQGIGIEVQEKNGSVMIVAPLDGSPAQKAGLHAGDVILKVNGQPIDTMTQAVNLILGPAGTSVTLTVQDSTGATREVTIVRAVINIIDVSWSALPGTSIAHLRISSFRKGTSAALDAALKEIRTQGATAIVLDLRENPGGLLEEAVAVASRFLQSGNVLLEKDANGKITPVPVERGVGVTSVPIVVLVDQGTASAAEIVTGAMRDAGRARIIGVTTFGTGTVLNQFSLRDGSALLIAVQEWLTPSGKTIWHTGLSPDVSVPLAAGVFPLLPETDRGLTESQVRASGDQQLVTAIDLLNPK
jgi:carboxyl-terminal processing protease